LPTMEGKARSQEEGKKLDLINIGAKVAQRFFLFIVGLHLYYWSLYIECYRMFDCSISWYLWGCAILNDGLRSQYVCVIYSV
jgi:hypothetical protein